MQKRQPFETQLTRLSLSASLPLFGLLLWVMIYAEISIWLTLLTALIGALLVFYSHYQIHLKSAHQFRSLSNLLDAMIQGDYSLRARSDEADGALDELVVSINGLAQRLSEQRWQSVESQLLLRKVIDHIDVAIVALSESNEISFFNPAAKNLLLLDQENSEARLKEQLTFAVSFSSGQHQAVELSLGHQQGRFNVHVEEFREAGVQHKLLFITDVRTLLRSEERKAWQSLVRVISHEINNSLSPIASISQTLSRLVSRQEKDQINQDLVEGLTIITERSRSLSQFVDSYKQLAKLPEPKKASVSLLALMNKCLALFSSESIVIESEIDFQISVDVIQFEQVIINLLKNAVESMQQVESIGRITVNWFDEETFLHIEICDEGAGISNQDNLFVPFYSTKKQGSGIGLVLCRQIVEAHGGQLTVSNREKSKGCCAKIELQL